MKKFTVFLLILITLLTAAVSAEAPANTFADVTAGHWAFDEIQFFYNAGIVAGIGDNYFAPDDNVTREQFAKLLAMLYSKTGYTSDARTFSDVTPEMWSYNYIETVKEYLTGYYPSGAQPFFNPAAKASREDVAYSLVKIIGLSNTPKDENSINKFSDAGDISPALRNAVGAAVENGLIRGYEDGTFKPQNGITRAETVVLLFRALKAPVVNNETPAPAPTVSPNTNPSPKPPAPSLSPTPAPPAKPTPSTPPNLNMNYKYNTVTNDIKQMADSTDNKGTVSLGWTPGTKEAYFTADLSISTFHSPWPTQMTVTLTEVISCGNTSIDGYFEVFYGGSVMVEKVKGNITISDAVIKLTTESNYLLNMAANIAEVWQGDGYDDRNMPNFLGTKPTPTPSPSRDGDTAMVTRSFTRYSSDEPIYFKSPDDNDFIVPNSGNSDITDGGVLSGTLNAIFSVGDGDSLNIYIVKTKVFEAPLKGTIGFTGTFEILKNGEIIDTVKGSAYIVDEISDKPYFKFYSEGEKWHFSGYITETKTLEASNDE